MLLDYSYWFIFNVVTNPAHQKCPFAWMRLFVLLQHFLQFNKSPRTLREPDTCLMCADEMFSREQLDQLTQTAATRK